MKEIHTLKALETFECTGSSCPRSCCEASWYFAVDSSTAEKWREVHSESDRKWLLDSISEIKAEGETQLKIKEDASCYFLNSDKLCEVQLRYGHSYLPSVCREYPRVNISLFNRMYKTASLSCPEIVRLALFDGVEDELYVKSQMKDDSPGTISENNAPLNYHLDNFVSSVLHFEKFPLGVRVFYIADVFGDMFNRANQAPIGSSQIDQLIKQTKSNLYDINLAAKQGRLKPDPVTAGSFWKVIFSLCRSRDINPVFMESESSPLTKTIVESGDSYEDYSKIYQVIGEYVSLTRPELRAQYGKLLQVYVKLYLSAKGFLQASSAKSIIVALVECMAGLCLLQMLMWMQLREKGSLNDDFLQELIVEVNRKYSHSSTVSERLEEDGHMQQIERYCICFLDMF
ncbi:flagellin lysine-N-methylase [Kaarinaea lacus]